MEIISGSWVENFGRSGIRRTRGSQKGEDGVEMRKFVKNI